MTDEPTTDPTAEPTTAEPTDDDPTDDEVAGERVHGVPVSWSRGQRVLHPSPDELLAVVAALRDDGFVQCLDVCGVDYLEHGGPRELPPGIAPQRYEVVVILISHAAGERVRLRVQVPAENPVVPSLFDLHPGSEAPEREVFDMFGIEFADHPDLTRILMPEDWIGHPLRKDFAVGAIPVQFTAPEARS